MQKFKVWKVHFRFAYVCLCPLHSISSRFYQITSSSKRIRVRCHVVIFSFGFLFWNVLENQ